MSIRKRAAKPLVSAALVVVVLGGFVDGPGLDGNPQRLQSQPFLSPTSIINSRRCFLCFSGMNPHCARKNVKSVSFSSSTYVSRGLSVNKLAFKFVILQKIKKVVDK